MFTESVRIGCSSRLVVVDWQKYMFDISPNLHNSVSGPWLSPHGNRPVVDLYGLLVTLPVMSYTITILS